jgi:hypothetical protein
MVYSRCPSVPHFFSAPLSGYRRAALRASVLFVPDVLCVLLSHQSHCSFSASAPRSTLYAPASQTCSPPARKSNPLAFGSTHLAQLPIREGRNASVPNHFRTLGFRHTAAPLRANLKPHGVSSISPGLVGVPRRPIVAGKSAIITSSNTKRNSKGLRNTSKSWQTKRQARRISWSMMGDLDCSAGTSAPTRETCRRRDHTCDG